MLLKRFYDTSLAQASFLVGCEATGEAVVVDPNRDIEQYLTAAAAEGVRITHVTETHIHADFVSGSRELAKRAGAKLFLSGEGGPNWQYGFANEATLLHDGDIISVGKVRLSVMHTPGHTPEHIVFMLTDAATTDSPLGMLSGDFIFAGDVGRPDLLERAAGMEGTMEAGARALFASLMRVRDLPDYLQLWPGHGAGSACGKALGALPSTTLGYERIANWGLTVTDEKEFVRMVLDGQPEPPAYFAQMKRINRDGPEMLGGFREPVRIDAAELPSLLERNALVVDIRPASAFAEGHVPGTISLPVNKSFTKWAGSLIPFGRPFYLMGSERAVLDASRELVMIGLDGLAGWLDSSAVAGWAAHGRTLAGTPQLSVGSLAAQRGGVKQPFVLDVRGRSEWDEGHLDGATNIPLAELPSRISEVPSDVPIVVHCQGGGRSAIAAGLLQAHGFDHVSNLTGGYGAWDRAGLPVRRKSSTAD